MFESHIHRTFKQLIEKVSGRCLGLFLKCYGEYLTRNHPEHEKRGFQCMSQANELLDVKGKLSPTKVAFFSLACSYMAASS